MCQMLQFKAMGTSRFKRACEQDLQSQYIELFEVKWLNIEEHVAFEVGFKVSLLVLTALEVARVVANYQDVSICYNFVTYDAWYWLSAE